MSSSAIPPMSPGRQLTVLCLASYYKGTDFIRECHRQGCRTLLLTSHSLKDENWPRESIDEIFYMPDVQKEWKLEDALLGVSYMARNENIDRIVALDDFDVETAATCASICACPAWATPPRATSATSSPCGPRRATKACWCPNSSTC